jgi:hypothetical protein
MGRILRHDFEEELGTTRANRTKAVATRSVARSVRFLEEIERGTQSSSVLHGPRRSFRARLQVVPLDLLRCMFPLNVKLFREFLIEQAAENGPTQVGQVGQFPVLRIL